MKLKILALLLLLASIPRIDAGPTVVTEPNAGTYSVSPTAPFTEATGRELLGAASLTPTIASVSSSGSVATGARQVTLVFSSDFTGSVLGVAFSGAVDASLTLGGVPNATLTAISYTVTTGSIRIIQLR